MTTQSGSVRAENVAEEFSTLNPFTYVQGACSQPNKGIFLQKPSHFLTIMVDLNHNSMVSFQDNQSGSVTAEIVTEQFSTLNPLTYTKVPVPNPIKAFCIKAKSFHDY